MCPKTLLGMLRWPSHLLSLCTIWAFSIWIIEAILLQVWGSAGKPLPQADLVETVRNILDLLVVLIQESPHKIIKAGLLTLEDSK